MKIFHFSDTHTFHGWLNPPECDIAIFSGDCTNPRDVYINEQQTRDFIYWYEKIPAKYKIFVAGNHDIAIERKRVTPGDFAKAGIIYLENTSTEIEGLRIWGSPITPTFGVGWAFNKDRAKTDRVWKMIPDNTDIIVTHGPAKGVLDLSYSRENVLEFCGCAALKRRIYEVKPKLFLFGHIHDCKDITNAGYTMISGLDTIFSNGTVVMDGKFEYGAIHNGNVFEL